MAENAQQQTLPPRAAPPAASGWRDRLRPNRFSAVLLLTIALFLISPLIAPGSLSGSALTSMLPFAAIMIIASLGQTFVIAQGGIDLSVPGVMAVAAVFATKVSESHGLPVSAGVLLGIAAGAVSGLVVGLAVVRFNIAPFVATLAVNSLLIGAVLAISDGFPGSAAPGLAAFAVSSVLGIPTLLLIAVLFVVLAHFGIRHTTVGRRLIAVGAGRPAAQLLGLRTSSYEIGAYTIAGAAYAIAGALLAGYLRTPDIRLGDSYQLTTIAAVVIGGSLLRGGISSIAATAVAALFLTQLGQVVLAAGAPTSVQLLVEAIVLAIAVVARGVPWRSWFARPSRRTT